MEKCIAENEARMVPKYSELEPKRGNPNIFSLTKGSSSRNTISIPLENMHCCLSSFFNLLSTLSFPFLIGNFMCLYCFLWNNWSAFCPHFITVHQLCAHSWSFGQPLTWVWIENLLPASKFPRFISRAISVASVPKNVANMGFYFRYQKALGEIWNRLCFKFFANKKKSNLHFASSERYIKSTFTF